MTPETFIRSFIETHEGGLSLHRADTGNWIDGKLIGSKYGVTGKALAAFRGVAAPSITAQQMADLTLDEAVRIGLRNYYEAPGLNRLPWDRVTASILDMAWGAGPAQAIKLLQRMIGTADDGKVGPNTIAAYRDWLDADKARAWGKVRDAFYDRIVAGNPNQRVFLKGWKSRTASFLPSTKWWGAWA